MRRRVLLVGIVLAVLAAVAPSASGATKPKFTLTSTAFSNNSTIPVEYTCTGAGMRPRVAWKHVPSGTKELAMIMEDPDAPIGTFVHLPAGRMHWFRCGKGRGQMVPMTSRLGASRMFADIDHEISPD